MVGVIMVVAGLAAFCVTGTALAVLLCGAARHTKRPDAAHADVQADVDAPITQVR
jgi:hypothetical protein